MPNTGVRIATPVAAGIHARVLRIGMGIAETTALITDTGLIEMSADAARLDIDDQWYSISLALVKPELVSPCYTITLSRLNTSNLLDMHNRYTR